MAEQAKCGNCAFWRQHPQFGGTCHRYAPRPAIDAGSSAVVWPTTSAETWCGEWEAEPGEPQVVF